MKKRLSPLLLLCFLLCLGLTACGGNKSINGEVVAVQQDPAALVLQKTDGRRIAVLLEEDTYILSGMDGFDGEAYRAAPHTGVTVSFYPEGRRTSLTTAEGEKLKAYRAGRFIDINSYLVADAYTLSDGTLLDTWEERFDDTRYQLKNGAELLWEDRHPGPENGYMGSLGFDSLSPAAQAAVTKFYADQGKLYDLDDMLERAYAEYQEDPENFCPYYVSQDTYSAASSQRVMYVSTNLTVGVSHTPGSTGSYVQTQDLSVQTAFDRETGEVIPTADLFTCPEDQLGEKLLNAVDWLERDPVKQEMIAAFRLDYLEISQGGFYLRFPSGSLPSQELRYYVSVDLTDDCKALLQPWAVPDGSGT